MLLLTGSACGPRYRLDVEPSADGPSEAVLDVWAEQRDVLVRILRDKKFTLREFRRAVDFFERLTCLPSRHHRSEFGPVPSDQLEWDLQRWDDWLRSHGASLQLAAEGTDLVAPPCEAGGAVDVR